MLIGSLSDEKLTRRMVVRGARRQRRPARRAVGGAGHRGRRRDRPMSDGRSTRSAPRRGGAPGSPALSPPRHRGGARLGPGRGRPVDAQRAASISTPGPPTARPARVTATRSWCRSASLTTRRSGGSPREAASARASTTSTRRRARASRGSPTPPLTGYYRWRVSGDRDPLRAGPRPAHRRLAPEDARPPRHPGRGPRRPPALRRGLRRQPDGDRLPELRRLGARRRRRLPLDRGVRPHRGHRRTTTSIRATSSR